MGERYLLRADRGGYGYKDLLEVVPGQVRFIVTDKDRRRQWWLFLGALSLAYLLLLVAALTLFWPSIQAWLVSVLGGLWGDAAYAGVFWSGFLAIAAFGDYYLPAYLLRHPVQIIPLEVLGSTSYGFFQELRARTGDQAIRITVNGTRKSVARAFRQAGVPFGVSKS